MWAGILRGLRRPILLLPFLGLLAACVSAEQSIGKSNQGMLLWALETVPTDRLNRIFSTQLAPYKMVPGILPLEPGRLPELGETVRVEPVRIAPPVETFLRDDGKTQVFWYATPVFGTDLFALAYFVEGGLFERSHFDASQRIPIAHEMNRNTNPRTYQMTGDVPLFRIEPGEAVYIGTFTATLTPGTRSFTGERRIRQVRRTYRIDHRDADGIVEELGLNPERLRRVDVFRNNRDAQARYRGAAIIQ